MRLGRALSGTPACPSEARQDNVATGACHLQPVTSAAPHRLNLHNHHTCQAALKTFCRVHKTAWRSSVSSAGREKAASAQLGITLILGKVWGCQRALCGGSLQVVSLTSSARV